MLERYRIGQFDDYLTSEDLTPEGYMRRVMALEALVFILNYARNLTTLSERRRFRNTPNYILRQAWAYLDYLIRTNRIPDPDERIREEVLRESA